MEPAIHIQSEVSLIYPTEVRIRLGEFDYVYFVGFSEWP